MKRVIKTDGSMECITTSQVNPVESVYALFVKGCQGAHDVWVLAQRQNHEEPWIFVNYCDVRLGHSGYHDSIEGAIKIACMTSKQADIFEFKGYEELALYISNLNVFNRK